MRRVTILTTVGALTILPIVGSLGMNPFFGLIEKNRGLIKPAQPNLLLQDPHEPNLCVNGKLLPKLYVLGAKNCGTSSIYDDLEERGFMTSPSDGKIKEWFFFKDYWQKHIDTNESEMKSMWFSNFLNCPVQSALMGDYTVPNLFVVPIPPGFQHSEHFGYPAKRDHPNNWNTAGLLHKFYGEQAHRVHFVIMLREPLARMQSEWYHTRPLHNCVGCMANNTFPDALEFNANLALKSTPEITDWIWKSMYARQIEEYLKVWNPSQFMIIPFKRYVDFDTQMVTKSLIKRLGLRGEPWSKAAHDNQHNDRPHLLDELPMDSEPRKLYGKFMDNENKRLTTILADAHVKGMELQGYTGKPGDGADIGNWLQNSW